MKKTLVCEKRELVKKHIAVNDDNTVDSVKLAELLRMGFFPQLVMDSDGDETEISGLCEECHRILYEGDRWSEDSESGVKVCHSCLERTEKKPIKLKGEVILESDGILKFVVDGNVKVFARGLKIPSDFDFSKIDANIDISFTAGGRNGYVIWTPAGKRKCDQ